MSIFRHKQLDAQHGPRLPDQRLSELPPQDHDLAILRDISDLDSLDLRDRRSYESVLAALAREVLRLREELDGLDHPPQQ